MGSQLVFPPDVTRLPGPQIAETYSDSQSKTALWKLEGFSAGDSGRYTLSDL
jgi:hypothetical protein